MHVYQNRKQKRGVCRCKQRGDFVPIHIHTHHVAEAQDRDSFGRGDFVHTHTHTYTHTHTTWQKHKTGTNFFLGGEVHTQGPHPPAARATQACRPPPARPCGRRSHRTAGPPPVPPGPPSCLGSGAGRGRRPVRPQHTAHCLPPRPAGDAVGSARCPTPPCPPGQAGGPRPPPRRRRGGTEPPVHAHTHMHTHAHTRAFSMGHITSNAPRRGALRATRVQPRQLCWVRRGKWAGE
jgi:hypothetical protein